MMKGWSNEAASQGWYDDRGWPDRMALAEVLGGFQPGDRLVIDRLLRHTPDDAPQAGVVIALHTAILLDRVPEALRIYWQLPTLACGCVLPH